MADDERYRSLADAELPSASTVSVAVALRCRSKTSVYLFLSHISCPLLHNFVDFKLMVLWSLVELPFWAQRSGKIID